jgi:cell division protein FtsZ
MDFTVVEEMLGNSVIKVVGVGGGGSNAVNRMIECGISGVEFLVANTDHQALGKSAAAVKVPIGQDTTKGLGAGGKPEIGEAAAQEDKDLIRSHLDGADMVFITAGMGGGTGTGAAPIIAKVAREVGALTVAVVTKPFDYEGPKKKRLAEEGIKKLHENVDTLITIPNQKLLAILEGKTSVKAALQKADDVLRMGVQGISDLITEAGDINIDFADVKTIMEGKGDALMGIGFGSGENRAVDAATSAIRNPLMEEVHLDGAEGLLVNIIAGEDFAMEELSEIMGIITANMHPDALVIHGMTMREDYKDSISVTVIATGFRSGAGAFDSTEEVRREPESDVVGLKEFESLSQGGIQRTPNSFLGLRGGEGDMDVPAVIRLRNRLEGRG